MRNNSIKKALSTDRAEKRRVVPVWRDLAGRDCMQILTVNSRPPWTHGGRSPVYHHDLCPPFNHLYPRELAY